MTINQPSRLSYTRRDLLSYHSDVTRYIKEFIPRITDSSEMNSGRIFLSIVEALVDNLNYSLDNNFLENILETARQRKNILRLSYALGHQPTSVSAATVDCTFSMISGVAGVGGKAIPVYTRCRSNESPNVEFLVLAATSIPEGESSLTGVGCIQGILVSGEILTSSSDGIPDQEYTLSNAKTPHSYIEVEVDGVKWSEVDNFVNSDDDDQHYILLFDEDDYTSVRFGDNENGLAPLTGSSITVNYIKTEAEDGNAAASSVTKIIGSLASEVSVTNPLKAAGGAVSQTNTSIKESAPAARKAYERAVTSEDYESVAMEVEGVYKAFAVGSEGARTDVYILPDGGGTASSALLDDVQTALDNNKIQGTIPVAQSLNPASISITVNIVTFNNNIKKSTVKQKVISETEDNLDYTKLTRGRGFTRSDLDGIYENIDDGTLIDYIDFIILTRIPRIVKSNASAPDFIGRVQLTNSIGYDEYLVTATSTTAFTVSKNGAVQTSSGTVATEYTTDNNEVTFTLGESGDTLTAGDTWIFKTSEYVDNIVIDSDEYMLLEFSSDLNISVFYPGEYDIANKTAL
jgi:hypothetical protein